MRVTSYQDIDNAIEGAGTYYQSLFLDYVNNFISVEGFARYHGFSIEEAEKVISTGRKIHKGRTDG